VSWDWSKEREKFH